MSLVLLDTNIVLRLLDHSAVEHADCVGAIEALLQRGDTLCLAPQILIELWVVATRPADVNGLGWNEAQSMDAIDHLQALFTLLADTPAVFDTWLAMVRKGVRGKRAHDARLAAFMMVHGIDRILTLNGSDFNGFPVTAVHPGAFAGQT